MAKPCLLDKLAKSERLLTEIGLFYCSRTLPMTTVAANSVALNQSIHTIFILESCSPYGVATIVLQKLRGAPF